MKSFFAFIKPSWCDAKTATFLYIFALLRVLCQICEKYSVILIKPALCPRIALLSIFGVLLSFFAVARVGRSALISISKQTTPLAWSQLGKLPQEQISGVSFSRRGAAPMPPLKAVLYSRDILFKRSRYSLSSFALLAPSILSELIEQSQ